MAARRLVIVMLVLLAISTIAATQVSPPGESGGSGTATRPDPGASDEKPEEPGPTEPGDDEAGGASDPKRVNGKILVSEGRPKVIRVSPGDQLTLIVDFAEGDDIEIPVFGLTETASEYGPARFDLIVDRPGVFAVRAVDADRVIGRIMSGRV